MSSSRNLDKALGDYQILVASELGLDRQQIPKGVLDIAKKLKKEGYETWIVGGAVRDLLLGQRPKDFDLATAATPEEIRKIFKRGARTVGSRFPVTLVYAGARDRIEVTTFRMKAGGDQQATVPEKRSRQPAGDQNYSRSVEDDALRRDFTCNALYFDPHTDQLLDFFGGVEDLKARRSVLIGSFAQRLSEDPVRILRMIRFRAKHGIEPTSSLAEACINHAPLLLNTSTGRLMLELEKILQESTATKGLQFMRKYQVLEHLIPILAKSLDPDFENLVHQRSKVAKEMATTMRRRRAANRTLPLHIYLCFLAWPSRREAVMKGHGHEEVRSKSRGTKREAQGFEDSFLPQHLAMLCAEIFELQPQLIKGIPKDGWRSSVGWACELAALRHSHGEDVGFDIAVRRKEHSQMINERKRKKRPSRMHGRS